MDLPKTLSESDKQKAITRRVHFEWPEEARDGVSCRLALLQAKALQGRACKSWPSVLRVLRFLHSSRGVHGSILALRAPETCSGRHPEAPSGEESYLDGVPPATRPLPVLTPTGGDAKTVWRVWMRLVSNSQAVRRCRGHCGHARSMLSLQFFSGRVFTCRRILSSGNHIHTRSLARTGITSMLVQNPELSSTLHHTLRRY